MSSVNSRTATTAAVHLLFLSMTSAAVLTAESGTEQPTIFYPFGPANGDTSLKRNDAACDDAIKIDGKFPFFGIQQESFAVNTDGAVTFGACLEDTILRNFPLKGDAMIAPFWADVDPAYSKDAYVYYRQSTDEALLTQASEDIRRSFSGYEYGSFKAKQLLIVTWDRVTCYGGKYYNPVTTNTFQCVLVTDGTQSFGIFNYGKLEWTSCQDDTVAVQIGFNKGDGEHYYLLDPSYTKDKPTVNGATNVGIDGRWIFRLDGTKIVSPSPDNDRKLTVTSPVMSTDSTTAKTDAATSTTTATTTAARAAQDWKTPTLAYSIEGQAQVLALMKYQDRLYVTRFIKDKTKQLATYSTKSSTSPPKYLTITDSIGPWMNGLAPCKDADNCFYVSSHDANAIVKVNLTNRLKDVKIKVDGDPTGIAVKSNGNVLVVTFDSMKVLEYTPGGALVREIQDANHLTGVIALADDRCAVTRYGPKHGVFLLTPELKNVPFGESGGDEAGMKGPRGMAVDSAGNILVADSYNNRILVLEPELIRGVSLPLPTEVKGPNAVWLDEKNKRLYVGEGQPPYRVLVFDNVENLSSLFKE